MHYRTIFLYAISLCVLSASSIFAEASTPCKNMSSVMNENVVFFNSASQSSNPDFFNDEYDYFLIFVYGQSYTVANDGGYRVTDNLDDDLYALGSISSTRGSKLVRVNETNDALNENIANSAINIIAKLCKKNVRKSPRFIIGNEGKGSRTILELMKESSVKSLLKKDEWVKFKTLETYENRYSRVLDYLENLKNWAERNNKVIFCPFYIYLQGESDTHTGLIKHGPISCSGGNYSIYKERLSLLLADLKDDIVNATGQSLDPVAFIYNVGNGQFHDTLNGISQAQTDISIEYDGIFSFGPYYAYPSYGAHPTPDGRRWMGEALAKLFFSTFMDKVNKSMFIASYSICGNKVLLNIKTPSPPLLIDNMTAKKVENSGFKAFDGNLNEIKICSVAVKDTQIELSFESLPSDDFYISYGSDGSGNIRDSDDWRSTYMYSSNDIGNMSSFAHYPVDINGNALIGKYYPMWNWLPFGFLKIEM